MQSPRRVGNEAVVAGGMGAKLSLCSLFMRHKGKRCFSIPCLAAGGSPRKFACLRRRSAPMLTLGRLNQAKDSNQHHCYDSVGWRSCCCTVVPNNGQGLRASCLRDINSTSLLPLSCSLARARSLALSLSLSRALSKRKSDCSMMLA